jgi:hypothetical protein
MDRQTMDKLLTTALSPDELRALWNKNIKGSKPAPKIVLYDEVIKTKSLDALFGNSNNLVVFYPGRQTNGGVFGHYVALFRNPKTNTVFFYDSYGGMPDVGQKRFSDPDLYNEKNNTLIRLFLDSGYNVDYNQYKHQKVGPIATCGRWSLLRNKFSELNNEQFNDLVKHASQKYNITPDEWAVLQFH